MSKQTHIPDARWKEVIILGEKTGYTREQIAKLEKARALSKNKTERESLREKALLLLQTHKIDAAKRLKLILAIRADHRIKTEIQTKIPIEEKPIEIKEYIPGNPPSAKTVVIPSAPTVIVPDAPTNPKPVGTSLKEESLADLEKSAFINPTPTPKNAPENYWKDMLADLEKSAKTYESIFANQENNKNLIQKIQDPSNTSIELSEQEQALQESIPLIEIEMVDQESNGQSIEKLNDISDKQLREKINIQMLILNTENRKKGIKMVLPDTIIEQIIQTTKERADTQTLNTAIETFTIICQGVMNENTREITRDRTYRATKITTLTVQKFTAGNNPQKDRISIDAQYYNPPSKKNTPKAQTREGLQIKYEGMNRLIDSVRAIIESKEALDDKLHALCDYYSQYYNAALFPEKDMFIQGIMNVLSHEENKGKDTTHILFEYFKEQDFQSAQISCLEYFFKKKFITNQ